MTHDAYLRVSTERQEVEHQKLGMLEYCHRRRMAPLTCVEDAASGTFSWRARAIGPRLEQAQAGDVIVDAEVSRLARSKSWNSWNSPPRRRSPCNCQRASGAGRLAPGDHHGHDVRAEGPD